MAIARVELVASVIDTTPLFIKGGTVHRWNAGIQREMTTFSKKFAPRRTGKLQAGIRGTVATTGKRRVTSSTWGRAAHTNYVVYGTRTPIMRHPGAHLVAYKTVRGKYGPMQQGVAGHWMKLRPYGRWNTMYKVAVRGQKANNFYYRAYVATRARHRSLPKARPVIRPFVRTDRG